MIVVFPSDFLSVFKGACASCGRIQPMVRRLGLCVSGAIANMLKNKDLTDTSCCVLSKMPNSQQEIKSRLSLGRFLEERGRGRTKAEARRTAFRLRLPSVSRSYLADATWCPCLLMPSRLIFDSSVCRGILSLAAAPEAPEMRPWDSANAVLIISTSCCANAARPLRPFNDSVGARLNQLSSTENVSPSHKMTPRSTTFCSSRMFPGQPYALNNPSVLLFICLIFLPAFFP